MSKYGPQVTIKMNECHAYELLALIEKLSEEMYRGKDWESRSTLNERSTSLVAQSDIKEGIKRFGKRQQKLFKKSIKGKDKFEVFAKRIEELKIMEEKEKEEDRLKKELDKVY
jgi:hypothetical protein